MISSHRKSVHRSTERALNKCQLVGPELLYACCTPVEYVLLCWHFCIHPQEYYVEQVKLGISQNSPHHFNVRPSTQDRMFPKSIYYMA